MDLIQSTTCQAVPNAQFVQLVGDPIEHELAVALRGIAAVAIAMAELFQVSKRLTLFRVSTADLLGPDQFFVR